MVAQVVTHKEFNGTDNPKFNGLQKIFWDWKSATGGAVTSATDDAYSGKAVWAVIIPDGSTTAPTANYDITITDADGIDILAGNGADCSATATEYLSDGDDLGAVMDSKLTLNIANAGDEKGGIVVLYLM